MVSAITGLCLLRNSIAVHCLRIRFIYRKSTTPRFNSAIHNILIIATRWFEHWRQHWSRHESNSQKELNGSFSDVDVKPDRRIIRLCDIIWNQSSSIKYNSTTYRWNGLFLPDSNIQSDLESSGEFNSIRSTYTSNMLGLGIEIIKRKSNYMWFYRFSKDDYANHIINRVLG